MWHTFIHSHWTVLGFAVALAIVLIVIAAVLLRRSMRRRRQARVRAAGKIAEAAPEEQDRGVELADGPGQEAGTPNERRNSG